MPIATPPRFPPILLTDLGDDDFFRDLPRFLGRALTTLEAIPRIPSIADIVSPYSSIGPIGFVTTFSETFLGFRARRRRTRLFAILYATTQLTQFVVKAASALLDRLTDVAANIMRPDQVPVGPSEGLSGRGSRSATAKADGGRYANSLLDNHSVVRSAILNAIQGIKDIPEAQRCLDNAVLEVVSKNIADLPADSNNHLSQLSEMFGYTLGTVGTKRIRLAREVFVRAGKKAVKAGLSRSTAGHVQTIAALTALWVFCFGASPVFVPKAESSQQPSVAPLEWQQAAIVQDQIFVREYPSLSSLAIATLRSGTLVEVAGREGKFYLIRFNNRYKLGRVGYVYFDQLNLK